MKFKLQLVISLFFILCTSVQAMETKSQATKGYRIELDIANKHHQQVFLVSYWNDQSYAIDSVMLSDKGLGILASDKPLKEGQYMILVKPNLQIDLLIGDTQDNIKLKIDDTDLSKCVVTGSNDTKLLWEYLLKQSEYTIQNNKLEDKLFDDKTSEAEKTKLRDEILGLNNKFAEYGQKQIEQNKNTWFAKFTKAMAPIASPYPAPQNAKEQEINKKYTIDHYFDNIDLEDPRMWTTNYFVSLLNNYMQDLIHNDPDTLAAAASRLVSRSKGNDDTYTHMLSKFVNESAASQIMGRENIWARLFEEHIMKKNVSWIDSTQMSELLKNYELLKNNRIGMIAKNMMLTDINGQIVNTDKINAEYILLYFYDPTCSHCIQETPILRNDIYAKYKDKGLKVVAINTNPSLGRETWTDFVDKNQLNDWINCMDSEYKSNFWLNYDTSGIPITYILDKDKKIIGKKVQGENVKTILDFYIED